MTFTKKLLASSVAAAAVTAASFAPVANAEVSASAAVATTYLWRGIDLGTGVPAVSADLSYSAGGAYATTWVSSGDTTAGTEYDLGVGYGGEVGALSYDISIWNYIYPTGVSPVVTITGGEAEFAFESSQEDGFGDLTEVILSLGMGPVSFTWIENVSDAGADAESYRYFSLGAGVGAFSASVGHHDTKTEDGALGLSMTHIDLGYAYNDNLSFTLSQVVKDQDDSFDDDLKLVASLSLPIE